MRAMRFGGVGDKFVLMMCRPRFFYSFAVFLFRLPPPNCRAPPEPMRIADFSLRSGGGGGSPFPFPPCRDSQVGLFICPPVRSALISGCRRASIFDCSCPIPCPVELMIPSPLLLGFVSEIPFLPFPPRLKLLRTLIHHPYGCASYGIFGFGLTEEAGKSSYVDGMAWFLLRLFLLSCR